MGGLAFWNQKQDRSGAYAAPDVGRQQYDGLSKEFSGSGRTASALGGKAPAEPTGLAGMWQKSTASVAGVFAAKPKAEQEFDATRLDTPSKKVGPDVYVAVARLMENQSKFPEAEQQYEKALKIAPKDLNALVGMARLHDRQGESTQALHFYQLAVKAHPN